MAGKITLTFLDRSNETSRVEVNVSDGSAANIEDLILQADVNQAGSLAAAIAGMSLCTPIKEQLLAWTALEAQVLPGNVYAQRELAVLMEYTDNVTGEKFHFSIPGPDWTNLAAAGSDLIDTTKVAYTALKTIFESKVKSPNGNAVTMTGGRLVGRNR